MNTPKQKRLLRLAITLEKLAKEIGRISLELYQPPATTKLVSVGKGGPALVEKAKRRGWKLFSYSGGRLGDGWCGDSPTQEYYIRKKVT